MRDENGVPQGYDLIWRGVEITTGAQREHRYEILKNRRTKKDSVKTLSSTLNSLNTAVLRTAVSVSVLTV